jgi:DNA-binding XRE family transcriptional regulator
VKSRTKKAPPAVPAKRRGPPCIPPGNAQTFAARLRRAREAAGLTMGQAAAKAGVEYKRWAKWERGPAEPFDAELARRIVRAIGCTIDDLTD